MLQLIFFIIIVYIIVQNLLDDSTSDDNVDSNPVNRPPQCQHTRIYDSKNEERIFSQIHEQSVGRNSNTMIFDKPNPWTKLIVNNNDEYPYYFHLKIKIPSLNDYHNWKKIIPNLDFNASTGELIIPSKDEPYALAIANLISINFMGQISLDEIIKKNLIQTSVNKAQAFELVQNKIRDQLNENLFGNHVKHNNVNYESDLCSIKNMNKKKSDKIDFLDIHDITEPVNVEPTVEIENKIDPDAYDGDCYSYL
jgi:hypothetical protein